MLPTISDTLDTGSYESGFIAKVALEAYAARGDDHYIAERYGLTVAQVQNWRRHLEQNAAAIFPNSGDSSSTRPGVTVVWPMDPHVSALDHLDISIAVLGGEDLRYVYANPAYLTHSPVADLIGKRMREVFPTSMEDGVEAGIRHVLQTGIPWDVKHFRATLPGFGDTVWEGRVARIPAAEGSQPAVLVWIRDITAAARDEEALRKQLALLQAISDQSTDVMYAKDAQGRIQFANPAALALLGKPLEEVIGKTDAELLADQTAAQFVTDNDRRVMESGVAEEVEEAIPMPDGDPKVWLSQKRPYINEGGEVAGLLGISRDITERKNSEKKVRVAHDTLQRVLDSITDGLALLDRNWHYTYFSETGARMLGVRSEDFLGKRFWDLFPHAEDLLFGKEYRRAMETGVSTHFEEYYPEPLNVWLECHCYPSPDGLSVYFRDITDRRRAQQAAIENERRINALLEATPVGLAYADAAGKILVMNAETKRIWGSPPQAASIDEYADFKGWWADRSDRHGEMINPHEWPTARALKGEFVLDTVVEIEPFDMPGTRRLVLHRSVPIHDDDGHIVGAVTALTDITESVQMKRAVVESNHRIRQLANTIPQLAWMADQSGAVHWFNDRWFDYTGQEEAEMLGWGWESVHHPDVLPQVVHNWRFSLEHGTAFEMTFPLKGKDGQFRPFYTLAEPLKDLEGNVVQWFGTCTDVSKLHSTQEELTKAQHWLQEGLETGRMVAWEWDFESDDVRYSNNAIAVLGYGAGKSTAACQTIHMDDQAAYDAAVRQAITSSGEIDQVTRRIRPDNGKPIWVRAKGHVLHDPHGQPIGMRGILIDVSEQALREQALEDASRRKDEFLAMLAHELRNPLAPIATAAQMLLLGGDSARIKTCSEIITRQLGHMTRLIDDLLDVSRVTRGLVELEREPVAVRDLVNSAVEQARPLIEARSHELNLQFGSTPASVLGDRVRLCQVIANLLNNSAKYTPQGGRITLSVFVEGEEVKLVVTDNGIGIDAQLLPHVFDLFTQATRTPDRAQGGLGLGLALVDSLVRMHGGQVSAHSGGTGQGARFVVALPLLPNARKTESPTNTNTSEPRGGRRLSIMLVDDNTDAVDMLAEMLRHLGHTVRTEYTSTAALSVAQHAVVDLYILDIGLPDLDGYELLRRLRAMPHNDGATFVALTGYGQAHDKVLSKSAGFDQHLVKPLELARLHAILHDLST